MAENTRENAILSLDKPESHNLGDGEDHIPNLVRMSSLRLNYAKQNLNMVAASVKLLVEDDLDSITDSWKQAEIDDERRLVRFKFKRATPTEYWVTFEAIAKQDFTHEQPVISCIFWKEKNLHVATSVDIISILEYLVQQSFTIEEKNRIRRNLQSLKPYTISRSNKSCQRFFNVLMNMEDPRPRNIEKDLKVFKWTDLFNAFNKVISKYAAYIQKNTTVRGEDKSVLNKSLPAPGRSDVLSATGGGIFENRGSNDYDILISSNENHESSFLPNERSKISKRKVTQSRNLSDRNKLFQHAVTPADPILIKHVKNKHVVDNLNINLRKSKNFDNRNENIKNSGLNVEDKGDTTNDELNTNEVIIKSEKSDSKFRLSSSIGLGTLPDFSYPISIPESESNSRLRSSSSIPASTSDYNSKNSNSNSNFNSNDSPSGYSSKIFSCGSSSTQFSLDITDTCSIGFNPKKKLVTDKCRDMHSSKLQPNIGALKEDPNYYKERQTHYFQYPSNSQLYDNVENAYKPLSKNNIKIHDEKTASGKTNNLKLPSLEPSIDKHKRLMEVGIELPPMKPPPVNKLQFNDHLPGPSEIQSNIEEYRKQAPNTLTQPRWN